MLVPHIAAMKGASIDRPLRIRMYGTRGVPAAYGGFETAVEEIGRRLAARGHEVTVYCRNSPKPRLKTYLGMTLVHLPAMHLRELETLSHTAMSMLHQSVHRKSDVAFIFNSANSPFLPLLRFRRVPTAVHMDGLEWKRGKWGKTGRRYYRFAEEFAVRHADALITDARGIADYYDQEFGISTDLLTYGAPLIEAPATDKLTELGLMPNEFHLVVARFEPENHVDMIVQGYAGSNAKYPLVVVGSAPYSVAYTQRIQARAKADPRVQLLGAVWDQGLLDQLYSGALTFVHGHSVGGTNPSLLRSMGAATAILAFDVNFNREVAGDSARYFDNPMALRTLLESAEKSPDVCRENGRSLQVRAAELYDWDEVALGYEALARRLVAGKSTRGQSRGRRSPSTPTDVQNEERQPPQILGAEE